MHLMTQYLRYREIGVMKVRAVLVAEKVHIILKISQIFFHKNITFLFYICASCTRIIVITQKNLLWNITYRYFVEITIYEVPELVGELTNAIIHIVLLNNMFWPLY